MRATPLSRRFEPLAPNRRHVSKMTRKRLSSMRKCCRRRLAGSASGIPPVDSRQLRRLKTPLDLPAAGRVPDCDRPTGWTRSGGPQRGGCRRLRPRSRPVIAVPPVSREIWFCQRNIFHPSLRGKCRGATRFSGNRNTVRTSGATVSSRASPCPARVCDPGRTPSARAPKNGPC